MVRKKMAEAITLYGSLETEDDVAVELAVSAPSPQGPSAFWPTSRAPSPETTRRIRSPASCSLTDRGCPRSRREAAPAKLNKVPRVARALRRALVAYGNLMPLIVTVRAPLASHSFSVKVPTATSGVVSASTNTLPPRRPGAMGSSDQTVSTFSSTPCLP